MPYLKTRRRKRYQLLKKDGFLPFEARALSVLPKATPALKGMRADRRRLLERFEKKSTRLNYSENKHGDKYRQLIRNKYKRNGWNATEGPKGRQKGPAKGRPVPWKMYKDYERQYPGKSYTSPWEKKKKKRSGSKKIDPQMVINLRTRKAEKRSGITQGRRGNRRY